MPTLKPCGIIKSAGVDWLTCTIRRLPGSEDFVGLAHELLNARLGEGYNERHGSMYGYKTIATDGLVVGERPEDWLIQLSGEVALAEWRTFAAGADTISRVDVQVTYELEQPDMRVARYMLFKARKSARNRRGNPPSIGTFSSWSQAELREKLKGDVPAGQTMYMGSPKSDFRLIGYDKGAESGKAPPGVLWRNELRLRRQHARRAAHDLLEAIEERPDGDRRRARDRVYSELRKRGIPPRFRSRDIVPISTERDETDKERWCRWMKTISPSFQRRAEQYFGDQWPDALVCLLDGRDPPDLDE